MCEYKIHIKQINNYKKFCKNLFTEFCLSKLANEMIRWYVSTSNECRFHQVVLRGQKKVRVIQHWLVRRTNVQERDQNTTQSDVWNSKCIKICPSLKMAVIEGICVLQTHNVFCCSSNYGFQFAFSKFIWVKL